MEGRGVPAATGTETTGATDAAATGSATDRIAAARRVVARPLAVPASAAAGVVIVVGGAGLLLRAWYLFHRPVNADEAIVGLMANQILHGHFSAFYWGQAYGGVEPYLVAPMVGIFGSSSFTMETVPILLSAGAAVVTWRIVRRLVTSSVIAVLAGVLVWAAPLSALSNSTLELGFRGVTLLCGLGLLLVVLRIADGDDGRADYVALGALTGLGWWSSPEIAYFLVPAGVLLAIVVVRDVGEGRLRRWGPSLLVSLVTGAVAALPWLWANAYSGLASIRPGTVQHPVGSPDYLGRLRIFFEYMLPGLFNLRKPQTGHWLGGEMAGLVVLAVLLAAVGFSLVVCWRQGGRYLALGIGVMVFPFLLAISPTTWFWEDGRYAVFLFPMLAAVLAVGSATAVGWFRQPGHSSRGRSPRRFTLADGTVPMLAVSVVLAALTVVLFSASISTTAQVNASGSFFSGWSNPNGSTLAAIQRLDAGGVHYGYADYWVAYRLDYLSGGRLQITTAPGDKDRRRSQYRAVLHAPSSAWLFVTPNAEGIQQFGSTTAIQGPAGMSRATFLSKLQHLGVRYRVVNAGLVQAVIPDRRVEPTQVGL